MHKRYFIIVLTVLISANILEKNDLSGAANNDSPWNRPTLEQIYEWWKPENRQWPDEQIEVVKIEPISLTEGENAFVAEVVFPKRGRNFAGGCLLIRPQLQEAREIEELGKKFGHFGYYMNRASCIWTETVASGQCTTHRHKRALYLDGWKAVVLHERKFGDNLGCCPEDIRDQDETAGLVGDICFDEEVAWTFTDLDNDTQDDLVELVIQKKGPGYKKLGWAAKVNWYLIKNGKFVPTGPSAEFDEGLMNLMKKKLFGD
jgi:hypothetical protein